MHRLLFADENFPLATVVALRALGHDVLTAAEAGKANLRTSDREILEIASATHRAVLTANRRHFIRLHSLLPNHAGIVVCFIDADFENLARRIHQAMEETGELAGQLLRVTRRG